MKLNKQLTPNIQINSAPPPGYYMDIQIFHQEGCSINTSLDCDCQPTVIKQFLKLNRKPRQTRYETKDLKNTRRK